ncbi:antibiotic resistance protein MarC [Boudabousia tangfeifanii]|uniref:UPF0056 membrane protein n=1 Tax=Boudabousia tangfeifanii TaxID=1912795 RepID=A0A1D9MKX6_9ACTO|nr:MarC family protein [Boudabousia tangfeifanii]AOZ72935.1 antibiotic resistance protein MarC [Boudabousia tangfeifanii]
MSGALFLKAFGALFAIMNPFVNLPIFLGLTGGYSVAEQKRTALKTVLSSTIMAVIIFFSGTALLRFFGVDLDNFRIAGGLMLLIIGLGMLRGSGSTTHEGTDGEKKEISSSSESISFYPMTFPMLIGPGTITTIIVLQADGATWLGRLTVFAALAVVLLLVAVVLYFSSSISKHMSLTLRTIMTRLAGMILTAIAVEMMTVGLLKVFPGWGA